MRLFIAIEIPFRRLTPKSAQPFDNSTNRACVLVWRPKVPGFGKVRTGLKQSFGQEHIARKGVEYVLPGTDGVRVSDGGTLSSGERSHHVRYEAVLSPVTATDYVTSSRRGDRDSMFGETLAAKEGSSIGCYNELSTPFATAIRIVPANRICLTIAPGPFTVLVALVAGNNDHGTHTL